MSDIISRQAAIDAMSEALKRVFSEHRQIAEKCLNALPSVQQWISCSERTPEKKRKTYWVCTDTEYQCECRWTNNRFGFGESDNWGWSIFDTPQYTKVIAWRELPEPYKGEQE